MELVVPPEVTEFVGKHIRSLDQLEVLLLVSALPDRGWTAGAVDTIVRSNPQAVAQWLEGFVASGIFIRDSDPAVYHYAPATLELSQAVAALGAAYKLTRHKIVELIYSGPRDEVRDFSDAFRFKKRD